MDRVYQKVYSRSSAAVVLVLSLLTLLAAGLNNVAKAFATVKVGSSPLIHWGSAVAIELGVVALGLTIAVLAKQGKAPARLNIGIFLFVVASVFANYDASLQSLIGGRITWARVASADSWTLIKAGLLGGALPVMVLLVVDGLRSLAAAGDHLVSEADGTGSTQTALRTRPRRGERPVTVVVSVAPSHEKQAALCTLVTEHPAMTATEVAKRLQIGRATLYRWIGQLGIERQNGEWIPPRDDGLPS